MPLLGVLPISVWLYFDRVTFWLPCALTPDQVTFLAAHSATKPGKEPYLCHNGEFEGALGQPRRHRDPRMLQCVQLLQPDYDALALLASIAGTTATHVEVSADLIMRDDYELSLAQLTVEHLIVERHGRRGSATIAKGIRNNSRYSKLDPKKDRTVDYPEHMGSRISGELSCFHIERRIPRARTLLREKLRTPKDLLALNVSDFIRKHVELFVVDLRKLGRRLRDKRNSNRFFYVGSLTIDADVMRAKRFIKLVTSQDNPPTQVIVDAMRPFSLLRDPRRYLVRIPIDSWLSCAELYHARPPIGGHFPTLSTTTRATR